MFLLRITATLLISFVCMGDSTLPDLTKWREIDNAIAESQRQKNLVYKKKEQVFFDKVTNSASKLKKFKIYKYVDRSGKFNFGDKRKHSGFKKFSLQKYRPQGRPRARSLAKGKVLGYEKGKRVYGAIIRNISSKFGVSANLVHAVINTESSYNSQAVSSAGAVGLMQLMPATAKRYGVTNRRDPIQNIKGGTQYLRDLLKLFDGDLRLTAAAYNAGENAVLKYNRSIPPYKETQNYVVKVINFYNKIEKN